MKRADEVRSQASDSRVVRTRFSRVLLYAFAVLLCVTTATQAQSGRRREPSASPTPTQRPRRATTRDEPGQPTSPNEPGRATGAPRPNAQAPAPSEPAESDEDEVYSVESNLVPVSANVMDAAGHAITDLKLEDFELRVDGQPKPISDLSRAETPVRLVLLFDNSDSIRATRELEKQAAMRFFRAVMRPVDQAAVYSVESIFTLEQPLTNDVSKLARTIERFGKPEGATRLFDAMAHAAEYLRPQPGRKVLVVVSDGADTMSDLTYDETLRRVLAADCQVFVVQTGIVENANLYDLLAVRRMEVFAQNTGGAVYVPKTTDDLETAFNQIAADLSQQYVLSYYPNDDRSDGRFRVISLRVTTRPNVRVRARRGYYPRRRTENLSALPQALVSADPAYSTTRDLSPNVSAAPREPAAVVRSSAPASQSSGPAYGSKNMDPETSGTMPRADADMNARPGLRLGQLPDARSDQPTKSADATAKPIRDERDHAPPAAGSLPPNTTTSPQIEPQPSPTDAATGTVDPKTPAPPPDAAAAKQSQLKSAQSRAGQAETAQAQSAKTQAGQTRTQESQTAPAEEPARTGAAKSNSSTSEMDAPQPPISVGALNGIAKSLPVPAYPETARRARVSGVVVVELVVDEGGKVSSARAVAGPVLLREAAVSAARGGRFQQTVIRGRPVRIRGFITYTFKL